MSKWCFNYESGEYEDIDKDGYSYTRGRYVYNWDDSDYRREEKRRSNGDRKRNSREGMNGAGNDADAKLSTQLRLFMDVQKIWIKSS